MKPVVKQIKVYARQQLQLATPPQIICKLHQRCAQLLQLCTTHSREDARSLIDQAQNIIAQLERSLKVDDQLSRSLYLLYDYCYCQLEKERVDEWRKALMIMSNLRDTFDQLHMPARI